MTTGIVLVTIGALCIFLNTVFLIAFHLKMRKENEMVFITLRTLREPKTSFLNFKRTKTLFFTEKEVIDLDVSSIRVKSETSNVQPFEDTEVIVI